MSGEAAAAGGEEVRLLTFTCGGERFALDVAFVREVLPAASVATTPVPLVPEEVAGVVNHRGAIFTVVRFALLAGVEERPAEALVLLRAADLAVGVAVDAIEGIGSVPARLLPQPGEGVPGGAALARRATDPAGRLLHAVDAERLIDVICQLGEPARAEG